jgi:hypothetical protein
MDEAFTCDVCHAPLKPHAFYIARIDVYADPSMPAIHTDTDDTVSNPATDIAEVMQQIQSMTEEELQDQVFRRFHYRLCPQCHVRFLANPLGLPRRRKLGVN